MKKTWPGFASRIASLMLDVPEFEVDLLDLETTKGLLKQRIVEEGIILYEK